jgi:hypothetical protein
MAAGSGLWGIGAGCVAGLVGAFVGLAGPAGAAPASTAPPTIDGTARFGQTVTCRPGAWSGDAVAFTYRWLLGGGPILQGPSRTPAEGPTLALTDPSIMNGNSLSCQVTAADAAGATGRATSASQRPEAGLTRVRITKVTQLPKGRVRIRGQVGPLVAVRAPWGTDDGIVVRRVLSKGRYAQLSLPVKVNATGRFTVVATDTPGRKRITVDYSSREPGIWSDATATRVVRFSKGGGSIFGGNVGVGG